MTKNQFWKRFCAGLLVLVLAFGLCACGKDNTDDASSQAQNTSTQTAPDRTGVEKVRLDHVYKMEYLDMEETGSDTNWTLMGGFNGIFLSNYYFEELADEEGNNYDFRSGNRLYSLDPNTGSLTLIRDFPENSSYDSEACVNDYTSYSTFTGAADGSLWCVRQITHEDWSDENNYIYETSLNLVHMDAQGEELDAFALTVPEEDASDYLYVSNLLAADNGDLVAEVNGNNSYLQVYSPKGKLQSQTKLDENEWIDNMCLTTDGTLVAWIYGFDQTTYENSEALYQIDLATAERSFLADVPLSYCNSFMSGPNNTILMQNSDSVYSYDPATGTLTELLNWLNSDINGNRLGNLVALADGSFLVTEYTADYDDCRIARLTSVGETTEKYVMTLAATYLDDNLRQAIIDFNKQNDEFRISYLDYSVYNTEETDYMGGYDQLSRDIVSGNVPDIISLEGLSVSTFASRGILADLSAMMASDSGFNQSDYLENVLNASRYQGKTVSLIPTFYLRTLCANPNFISDEGGWTVNDMKALLEQYPDAALFEDSWTRDTFMYQIFSSVLPQYIDQELGTCDFSDPSFGILLELMKAYPEEIDWEEYDQRYNDADYWEAYDSQYRTGKVLLCPQYISGFDTIREMLWSFGGDFDLVGYPSRSGAGIQLIEPSMELGISSSSKLKDVAWEFMKYLLSYDFQSRISWGMPINRQAIEENIAKATPSPYEPELLDTDETDASEAEVDYYATALTEEQIAKVRAALESAGVVSRDYSEIINIITEEASGYFSGQKTAQAAADIIQSRVGIYLSENS